MLTIRPICFAAQTRRGHVFCFCADLLLLLSRSCEAHELSVASGSGQLPLPHRLSAASGSDRKLHELSAALNGCRLPLPHELPVASASDRLLHRLPVASRSDLLPHKQPTAPWGGR